jgi:hypothetical protein
MRNSLKTSLQYLAMLLVLGSAACGDASTPIESAGGVAANAVAWQDPERAALDELTRAVALAMNDAGLRHRVLADLRASRFTVEHKLHLRTYLHGQSGGILLNKLMKGTGRTREGVLALVDRVRPLEFYMPVQAHRESWTGGPGLYVGSLLADHTVPIVYDLAGRRVNVAVDAAPELPTLALVPVESDFSRPLPAQRFRNGNDRGGEAIGTLFYVEPTCDFTARECVDDGTIGGGGITYPRGLYYTASSMYGVGEGGLKGKPEIEVHVERGYDPNQTSGSSETPFVLCQAGETKSGLRYFNQDAEQWTGNALVLDSTELVQFGMDPALSTSAPRAFAIWLVEDDTAPCELRGNHDRQQFYSQMNASQRAFSMAVTDPRYDPEYRLLEVFVSAFLLKLGNALFFGEDEDLGSAVALNPSSGHTHQLLRENFSSNGSITLRIR